METTLIIFVSVFLVAVFLQFGGRLSARFAASWWLGGLFILISAIYPSAWRPLADLMGIKFLSNLVLSGLVLFLFAQCLDLTAGVSVAIRSIRLLVVAQTAQKFAAPRLSLPATSTAGPSVLVVVPCYNERASIPDVIARLQSLKEGLKDFRLEFVIIDDGSRDSSVATITALAPENLACHQVNIGVAGVLLTGFKIARELNFDYVVQCDGDGQHPIERIPDLLQKAIESGADMVVGTRLGGIHMTSRSRYFGIQLIRMGLLLFGRLAFVSDPTSGLRAYSSRAQEVLARNMPDEYPEPETIAIMALEGLRMVETPVAMSRRLHGESSITGFKTARYMFKVFGALVGLRLRTFAGMNTRF